MKPPVDQAREWFGGSFHELCDYYFDNGYLYSGADAFAMAMPHSKASLMEQDINKELDKCDCWYVQYVAGDLKRLLEQLNSLPFDFEWIVFNRDDGDYRACNLKRMTEKLNGKIKST